MKQTKEQKTGAKLNIYIFYAVIPIMDADGSEGDIIGWFTTKKIAEQGAIGQGWNGANGKVGTSCFVQWGADYYRLDGPVFVESALPKGHNKKNRIRARALAKLTPEERGVLGL